MDCDTAKHFYAWLDRKVYLEDQHVVEEQIHALLKEHSDLIEKNYSWPEMLRMAEIAYPRELFI